jgi:hypothetical protein
VTITTRPVKSSGSFWFMRERYPPGVIRSEVRDHVAEVVIDNQPVNALPVAQWFELADTIRTLGRDPEVRALIVSANPDIKGYQAGVDIKELAADPTNASLIGVNRGCWETFAAVYDCEVPVIAAVHGYCLGGGVGIAGMGGIAGMAGVALSQIGNVSPNLGTIYIVDSFLVVVFGGVGNLLGTLVGALTLGIVNKVLEPVAGAILGKIVVLAAIIFEYSNGFHDAANAIATVVSTKVLTPRQAIAMAATFNLTGALLGGAVASTIGKGLVDTNVVMMSTVLCALIGILLGSSHDHYSLADPRET